MNKFEILLRRINMFFTGKKYCNYKTRHGHDLEVIKITTNKEIGRIVYYSCTVCGKDAYVDFTGVLQSCD